MRSLAPLAVVAAALPAAPVEAAPSDTKGVESVELTPTHDTWSAFDDPEVHGGEERLRVGVVPQGCQSNPEYTPCEDDGEVCCKPDEGINYCAATESECGEVEPSWSAGRKYRSYVRFDLSSVPEGKIVRAELALRTIEQNIVVGGPPEIALFRLSSIEPESGAEAICAWDEDTLAAPGSKKWSSLPSETFDTDDPNETVYDVTGAVESWLKGDPNDPSEEPAPNCGLMIQDQDFYKEEDPIHRWIDFSSKEGAAAPQLTVVVAQDVDGDGYPADVDCNEDDTSIHPDATEDCNGVDDDCDGATDEENCDGVDNDCDGATDEGTDLCGPGRTCVNEACETTCEDDCSDVSDTKCDQTEDGSWRILACGDEDADPCLDWYPHEPCEENETCETFAPGIAACELSCDPPEDCSAEHGDEGKTACKDTASGEVVVKTCGQFDDDACLEWGDASSCPKGTSCQDGQCQGEPCEDVCEQGATRCEPDGGDVVQTCLDWGEDNPCLVWGGDQTCGGGATCDDGVCVGGGGCEDECSPSGATQCGGAEGDAVRSCGDHDDDACLEWSEPEPCGAGASCSEGSCLGGGEPGPEPAPDVAADASPEPAPDVAPTDPDAEGVADAAPGAGDAEPTLDAAPSDGTAGGDAATDGTGDDTSPPDGEPGGDGGTIPFDGAYGDDGGSGGDGGGGCGGCRSGPSGAAPWLTALLLVATAGRARRRRARPAR